MLRNEVDLIQGKGYVMELQFHPSGLSPLLAVLGIEYTCAEESGVLFSYHMTILDTGKRKVLCPIFRVFLLLLVSHLLGP
jgi:hypothetical protein